VLVWLLLRKLKVRGAWVAGAIFALHPVYVESVAWITERKNVLSGMFYLLAVGSYLRFADRRDWRWYAGALGFFVMALLSKTVTSSLPIVLLFILWLQGQKVSWRKIGHLIPFVAIGLIMGLLTVWYEVHHVGAQGEEWNLSILQRILLAGRALWFYAIKLVWPVNLTFIYPRWQLTITDLRQWLWPLGAAAVGFVAWWFHRRVGRGPLVGLAFFSITLFPALGFFDVYPMRYSFVADHFQYLASLGLIALSVASAAWGFERLGSGQKRWRATLYRLEVVLVVIVLLVLGLSTWKQTHAYKDLKTLWQDTIHKNPKAWMAHTNLGLVYFDQGRIEEAITEYQAALSLSPNHANIHTALGAAYFKQRHIKDAIKELKIALKLDPNYADAHNNLGLIYFDQGQIGEAIREYKLALKLNPYNAGIHGNLGRAYFTQGRIEEAINEYLTVVRIKPDHADAHYNLGAIYQKKGMFKEAVREYKKVLEFDPMAVDAHYNIGVIYTMSDLFDQAVVEFQETLRIDPGFEEAKKKLEFLNQFNRQRKKQQTQ
ncbi:MAG: tetratricopeptide repeat protein, partial [Thermodesulfobacteriota bacterium]